MDSDFVGLENDFNDSQINEHLNNINTLNKNLTDIQEQNASLKDKTFKLSIFNIMAFKLSILISIFTIFSSFLLQALINSLFMSLSESG